MSFLFGGAPRAQPSSAEKIAAAEAEAELMVDMYNRYAPDPSLFFSLSFQPPAFFLNRARPPLPIHTKLTPSVRTQ